VFTRPFDSDGIQFARFAGLFFFRRVLATPPAIFLFINTAFSGSGIGFQSVIMSKQNRTEKLK